MFETDNIIADYRLLMMHTDETDCVALKCTLYSIAINAIISNDVEISYSDEWWFYLWVRQTVDDGFTGFYF